MGSAAVTPGGHALLPLPIPTTYWTTQVDTAAWWAQLSVGARRRPTDGQQLEVDSGKGGRGDAEPLPGQAGLEELGASM